MRAVNLLPKDRARRGVLPRLDPAVAIGGGVTFVVVAALTGGFVLSHSHAASEQQKLAAARSRLALAQAQQSAHGPAAPTLTTPAVTGQEAPWRTALETALSSRVAWDDVLAELARVVPPKVTVSNLTLGASGSAAGSLTVGGTAFSEDGVAQLLSRLALVPDLGQVTLTSSSADPKSGIVTFTVNAQVEGLTTSFTAAPPTTTTTSGASS